MAEGEDEDGLGLTKSQGGGRAKVRHLTRKKFRRTSIDAFSEDFCNVLETAADDVVNGRLDPMIHNSMQRAYSNMLQMMDLQYRIRKNPLNSKMLKP